MSDRDGNQVRAVAAPELQHASPLDGSGRHTVQETEHRQAVRVRLRHRLAFIGYDVVCKHESEDSSTGAGVFGASRRVAAAWEPPFAIRMSHRRAAGA